MANQITDRVAERIETRLTDQKSRAADTVSTVAQTLLSSSQQLREQGQEDVSRYIERAADQVERVANYLQRTDVDEVVHRVEDFARRQPATFMAGAFAIGFIASRFLKSSRNDQVYDEGYDTYYGGRTGDGIDTDRTGGYEAGSNFDFSRTDSTRTSSQAEMNYDTNRGV
ncbi:MAG: hypothetical protein ACT4O1_15340 [Gemmatimonadota bacterium]